MEHDGRLHRSIVTAQSRPRGTSRPRIGDGPFLDEESDVGGSPAGRVWRRLAPSRDDGTPPHPHPACPARRTISRTPLRWRSGKRHLASWFEPRTTTSWSPAAGEDRVATSSKVSQQLFPKAGQAKAVVVATSATFADALAGGRLAADQDAPCRRPPGISSMPWSPVTRSSGSVARTGTPPRWASLRRPVAPGRSTWSTAPTTPTGSPRPRWPTRPTAPCC